MSHIISSQDYEDYFDSTQVDLSAYLPHPSEVHNPPPDIQEDSVIQFTRISAVGNSSDPDGKSYSVYYLEVKCPSLPNTVWFVYRRYSQFRKLSDALRSEGYYVPVLPAKQQSHTEVKVDSIRRRKYDLESWLKSLSEQSHIHSGAKDPQFNITFRQFLLENANCPPTPLIRVFPENMALRSSTDTRHQSEPQPQDASKPYVKVNIGDFELIRVIGKGSFGKVYSSQWIIDYFNISLF